MWLNGWGTVLQNVGAGDVSKVTAEQRADSPLWETRPEEEVLGAEQGQETRHHELTP